MKKIIVALIMLLLTSCSSSKTTKIQTVPEKIGNLTIQAPVGWEKVTKDDYEDFIQYSYYLEDGDETPAFISIYYDREPTEDYSISDFDPYFDPDFMNSNSDVLYTYDTINDDFLGNKPIRKASGTWYNGNLYDRTFVMMYDADCKKIAIEYVYLNKIASEGYADFANEFLDGMILTYDYQ